MYAAYLAASESAFIILLILVSHSLSVKESTWASFDHSFDVANLMKYYHSFSSLLLMILSARYVDGFAVRIDLRSTTEVLRSVATVLGSE